MRKLLQSKTGVSWLVAIAVLCVAANFVSLPKRHATTAAAREAATQLEEAPDDTYQVPPVIRVEASLRAWQETASAPETAGRDPFAAIFVAPPAAFTNSPTMPSFQLQAVSIAGGRTFAVVNQRVVAEGETLEGCRVDKILPNEVRLVSPLFGPITATFDRTSNQARAARPNKAATENPSDAVLPASPASGTGGTSR